MILSEPGVACTEIRVVRGTMQKFLSLSKPTSTSLNMFYHM